MSQVSKRNRIQDIEVTFSHLAFRYVWMCIATIFHIINKQGYLLTTSTLPKGA